MESNHLWYQQDRGGHKREGVSRAANDEWSEELAEGLGVERVRWLFRARTNGRPMEHSDFYMVLITDGVSLHRLGGTLNKVNGNWFHSISMNQSVNTLK